MIDAYKKYYEHSIAWRTMVSKVTILTEETVNNPATYRVYIKPIDQNEPGAENAEKSLKCYLKDNSGHTYRTISFTDNYIDVSDDFRCKECPQSGRVGVYYKSSYKGNSIYLSQAYYRYLDKRAIDYSRIIESSILWGNDPNPRRIPFTNIYQPSIPNYTTELLDSNGELFNAEEDYGQNPKFEIWVDNGDSTYSKQQVEPFVTRDMFGNIVSVLFSGTGDLISGYILISR